MKSNVQPLFLNHFSGEMSNILGLETYRQLHLWGQIQKKRWPSRLLFLTLYIQQTFIDFINSISIYWPDSVRTLGLQKVIKPRKLTHQHRHLQYRRSIARVVVLKHMNTNPKKSFLEKGTCLSLDGQRRQCYLKKQGTRVFKPREQRVHKPKGEKQLGFQGLWNVKWEMSSHPIAAAGVGDGNVPSSTRMRKVTRESV